MSMKPDDHRRKWNRDEYEKLAEERRNAELKQEDEDDTKKKAPIKRELLKKRDYKLDLESKIGKSVLVNATTSGVSQTGAGYYCKDCDCMVKDSISYLDHVNGRSHQRNLGMSMRIERSSLDAVKARFGLNKQKMEEKKKDYDMAARMKEIAEEEEKLKEYRRAKRKEKKRKAEDVIGADDQNSELASIMGFGGFGASKKTR